MNMSSLNRKVLFSIITVIIAVIIFNVLNMHHQSNLKAKISLSVNSSTAGDYQLYYTSQKDHWTEENSIHTSYDSLSKWKKINFYIPVNTKQIRLDPGNQLGNIQIKDAHIKINTDVLLDIGKSIIGSQQVNFLKKDSQQITVNASGTDPGIYFNVENEILSSLNGFNIIVFIKNVVLSLITGLLIAYSLLNIKTILKFLRHSVQSRKLIFSLAKNDFKTKYASSYLGVVWGFIQPLITILTYWFVFQVGLRSGNVADVPFILWFLVAIIPWFFFSDAISGATNSFFEYSYLVKKVVFKIEVIPSVKIISSLYVHLFFILFIFIVYTAYGYTPDYFNLQFLYYTGCMIVLVIAIAILTSSTVLFFRDLNQIIAIVLQIGFWFTPIGWPSTMLSPFWLTVFKLNPMYYIVEGYRDSFINHIWFFEHPYHTLYFWLFCLITITLGVKMFNRLRTHFSDVL